MERFGRTCVRYRWLVVAGWLMAVVALNVAGGAAGGPVSDDFDPLFEAVAKFAAIPPPLAHGTALLEG